MVLRIARYSALVLACAGLFQQQTEAGLTSPIPFAVLTKVAQTSQIPNVDPSTATGSAAIDLHRLMPTWATEQSGVDCQGVMSKCLSLTGADELVSCAVSLQAIHCEMDDGISEHPASKAARKNLKAALKTKIFKDVSDATYSAAVFQAVDEKNLGSIISVMDELFNVRIGAFHEAPGKDVSNDLTWKGLRALGALINLPLAKENASFQKLSRELIAGVEVAIDDSDDSGSGPLTFGSTNTLESTGRLLFHFQQLRQLAGSGKNLSQDTIDRFAEYLVGVVTVSHSALDVTDLDDAIAGLASIADSVVVSSFSADDMQVKITNPLGLPTTDLAQVVSASIDKKKMSVTRKRTKSEKESVWELQAENVVSPGVHTVKFVVDGPIGKVKESRTFAVSTAISVSDFVVSITRDTKSTGGKTVKLAYPKRAADVIQATTEEYFHVSLSVKDKQSGTKVEPSQLVVRMEHIESGTELFFELIDQAKSDSVLLSLSLGNQKELAKNGGKYKLSLFVGDTSIKNPIDWEFATLNLDVLEMPKEEGLPIYKRRLLYDSDVAKKALPEIHHKFREPDRRAGSFTASVFSLTLVVVLLGSIASMFLAGGNLRNFSFSIWNLLSIVLVGSILGIYVVFWVKLSLFTALYMLVPTTTALLFVGHAALADRHKKLKLAATKEKKSE